MLLQNILDSPGGRYTGLGTPRPLARGNFRASLHSAPTWRFRHFQAGLYEHWRSGVRLSRGAKSPGGKMFPQQVGPGRRLLADVQGPSRRQFEVGALMTHEQPVVDRPVLAGDQVQARTQPGV
jgi:hypothetical protein